MEVTGIVQMSVLIVSMPMESGHVLSHIVAAMIVAQATNCQLGTPSRIGVRNSAMPTKQDLINIVLRRIRWRQGMFGA